MAAHALTNLLVEVAISDAGKAIVLKSLVGEAVGTEDNTQHGTSTADFFTVLAVLTQVVVKAGADFILDTDQKVGAFDQEVDALGGMRAGLPFNPIGGLDAFGVTTVRRPVVRGTTAIGRHD